MSYPITKGKTAKALKFVVYGPEGVGKTTFASQFPDPVFIDTEKSTIHMDVARFPAPTSWKMLIEEVQQVRDDPTCCKTLVIDTIDWAERLAQQHIITKMDVDGIEAIGYGKGHVYVKEEMGKLLDLLSEVTDKGVNVVLLGHCAINRFTKPDEMGEYDRYELKLTNTKNVKVTSLVKEWADDLFFANYKSSVVTDQKTDKKYLVGNERVMYTEHQASYDAKNRHGMPSELPFKFESIAKLFKEPTGATSGAQTKVEPVNTPPKEETPQKAQETSNFDINNLNKPTLTDDDMAIINQLDPKLKDLMVANEVSPSELLKYSASKGHFPEDTDPLKLPQAYIDQIISHWNSVFADIQERRNLPF